MSFTALVRVYPRFARCAFQRRAAYRLANWTGMAVNFFFFLIQAQVFFAFFRGRASVAGWRADDAVRYFATFESLLMVLGVMSSQTGIALVERIRSGDVVVDLARPIPLWARCVAESYGSALYYALTRTVVLYAAAIWLYRLPLPPRSVLVWAPPAIALAIGIVGALMYLAGATAYWIEHAHGPIMLLVLALSFLGGAVVPLDFYPAPLRWVTDVLPFRGAVYTPIAIANGSLAGVWMALGLAQQATWLALLWWLAHVVEQRGTQRLAAQGG